MRDYQSELDSLRDKERKILKRSQDRRYEINKIFASETYKKFKTGIDVMFSDMSGHIIGEVYDFPSLNNTNVSYSRVETGKSDEIKFVSKFEGKAVLYAHTHPDFDEYISIHPECNGHFIISYKEEGKLLHMKLDDNSDSILIPAGVEHQIINILKTPCRLTATIVKIK